MPKKKVFSNLMWMTIFIQTLVNPPAFPNLINVNYVFHFNAASNIFRSVFVVRLFRV